MPINEKKIVQELRNKQKTRIEKFQENLGKIAKHEKLVGHYFNPIEKTRIIRAKKALLAADELIKFLKLNKEQINECNKTLNSFLYADSFVNRHLTKENAVKLLERLKFATHEFYGICIRSEKANKQNPEKTKKNVFEIIQQRKYEIEEANSIIQEIKTKSAVNSLTKQVKLLMHYEEIILEGALGKRDSVIWIKTMKRFFPGVNEKINSIKDY